MKVSFNQVGREEVRADNGFGYAANKCKESLRNLGHEVGWRDTTADVEINFIQPHNWYWSGVDYRIGYLPWESTEFRPGWIDSLNEVDEVWTPSPVIAQWMMDAGVKKEPKIYQHGVEAAWEPVFREVHEGERFKLLHHGGDALRKGVNETIQAFTDVLWNEHAQLQLKMMVPGWATHNTDRIILHKKSLPLPELVKVYQDCHVMCYPSWGEGFGLAPLQAMATGMPVLVTKGWAPYEHLLPEEYLIDSHLEVSPWQDHHPGKMFQPSQEDLTNKLLNVYENFDYYSRLSFDLSEKVHAEYNWDKLTEEAFAHFA